MSFANKGRDSKDVSKLRAEYEAKAVSARETSDPASKRKAIEEKSKAFEKMKAQIVGERQEEKAKLQKVLINQGTLKTKEQHAAEVSAAKARAAQV